MSEETMAMDRIDDAEEENGRPEEDFGALFEKESKMPGRLTPGQKIKTTVISVSGDLVYVDLGGKSEGAISLSEFVREDGTAAVAEGDQVEAFFLVRTKRREAPHHAHSRLFDAGRGRYPRCVPRRPPRHGKGEEPR